MQLKTILTQLESGAISAEQAEAELINGHNKLRSKIENLRDLNPYSDMQKSTVQSTKDAADNAMLGWRGALACALLVIDQMMGKDVEI